MESSEILENINTSHVYKDNDQPVHDDNVHRGMRELDISRDEYLNRDENLINTHADEINTDARRVSARNAEKAEWKKRVERYNKLRETAGMVHLKMELFAKSTSSGGNAALVSDARMKIGYFLESTRKIIDFSDNAEENKVLLNRSIDLMMTYISQAIDSCNVYMLSIANSKEKNDTYKQIRSICHDLSYELIELNTQKSVIANGSFDFNLLKNRKLLPSDFIVGEQTISKDAVKKETDPESGDTYYTVNGKKCKVVDAKNIYSKDRQADIQLASALGLKADDFATQYAHYNDEETKKSQFIELPETGKTLADINNDGLVVEMSPNAQSKLQQIYLFDLLRGKKRNANNIKVSYIKSAIEGEEKFRYIIKDVKMTGVPEDAEEERELSKNDIYSLDEASKERILKIAKKVEAGDSDFVNGLLSENATEEVKTKFLNRIRQMRDVINIQQEAEEQGAYRSLITTEIYTDYANDHLLEEERKAIESTMDATCAMSFAPKHKKGPGSGKAGWFFNRVKHYVFSIPNRLINWGLMGARKVLNVLLPSNDRSFDSKTRNLQAVPGKLHIREAFDDQKKIKEDIERGADDQEIMDDKRYMPLAFEEAIPDETEKPPYVTLKVNEGGHSFLEMSYTRINKQTKQKQRYRVNFGFYPKLASTATDSISQGGSGVIMPGVIYNERIRGSGRCVAGKRFTVTNKQINRIVAFTHDFEKGGYNIVKRNCATFSSQALKAGQIDSGDLFRKKNITDVAYTAAGAAGTVLPITGAISMFSNTRFKRFGKVEDMTYQSFGQNVVSQEEYERLYSFNGTMMEAHDPKFFEANIKNQSSNHGDIIAYDGALSVGTDSEGHQLAFDRMRLTEKIDHLGKAINTFEGLIKEDIGNDIPADLVTEKITVLQSKLLKVNKEGLIIPGGAVKTDVLLDLKKRVEENVKYVNDAIAYCNELYNEFFHADMRVQEDMYYMVSTLNYLKEDLYTLYSDKSLDTIHTVKQSDNMKTRALIQKNTTLTYQNENGEEVKSPDLSLRTIAASMELFGSSREYIDFAKRYNALDKMKARTAQEDREYGKLRRKQQLIDTFVRVHQMYFDNDVVSTGFVDIAFGLMPLKEKDQKLNIKWNNGFGTSSLYTSVSQLYQSECFSKIFDSVWQVGDNGAVSFPDGVINATDEINRKMNSDATTISQMETIFKAVEYANNLNGTIKEDRETVAELVYESLIKNYLWSSVAYEYETSNGRLRTLDAKKKNCGENFYKDALKNKWINANLLTTITNKYGEMTERNAASWTVLNREQPVQEQQNN